MRFCNDFVTVTEDFQNFLKKFVQGIRKRGKNMIGCTKTIKIYFYKKMVTKLQALLTLFVKKIYACNGFVTFVTL